MLTVVLRTDNSRVSLLEQVHTAVAVALVLAITYGLLLLAGPSAGSSESPARASSSGSWA